MKNFSDSHPGVKGLAFKHTPSVEFTLLSKMTNLVGRQAELVKLKDYLWDMTTLTTTQEFTRVFACRTV
jgi:hypothetical protein